VAGHAKGVLRAPPAKIARRPVTVDHLVVRSATRALLAELGLARILLGSCGGGQFLVVLPGEARGAAEAFSRRLHARCRISSAT